MKKSHSELGFTLVELLVAAVIGLATTMVGGKVMLDQLESTRKIENQQRQRDDWTRSNTFITSEINLAEEVSKTLLEDPNLSKVTNHPAHIIDDDGRLSPSSFIPFCWFENGLDPNTKIEGFPVPVCNSFKPKLRNDQYCYEMDPNKFLHGDQTAKKIGLYLLIDEKKDRQLEDLADLPQNMTIHKQKESFIVDLGNEKETFIFLETIGNII